MKKRPKKKLPEWEDLLGIAPEATGDLSSEDFIRQDRNSWDKRLNEQNYKDKIMTEKTQRTEAELLETYRSVREILLDDILQKQLYKNRYRLERIKNRQIPYGTTNETIKEWKKEAKNNIKLLKKAIADIKNDEEVRGDKDEKISVQ